MTIFQGLVLGLLQGITEFLPVSSSGHLVIAEYLLPLSIAHEELLHFDVILHGATLCAIIFCYAGTWKTVLFDGWSDPAARKLLFLLIVATIPAALIGLLYEDAIAALFRDPRTVGTAFIASGLLLIAGERVGENARSETPTWIGSIMIGISQAVSLIPGISRSGATISAGRMTGLTREAAVDFSFLMAAPIIGGAVTLSLVSIIRHGAVLPSPEVTTIGFLASLLSSIGVIVFLRRWVRRKSLSWFALYLIPLGAASLVL